MLLAERSRRFRSTGSLFSYARPSLVPYANRCILKATSWTESGKSSSPNDLILFKDKLATLNLGCFIFKEFNSSYRQPKALTFCGNSHSNDFSCLSLESILTRVKFGKSIRQYFASGKTEETECTNYLGNGIGRVNDRVPEIARTIKFRGSRYTGGNELTFKESMCNQNLIYWKGRCGRAYQQHSWIIVRFVQKYFIRQQYPLGSLNQRCLFFT